MGNSLEALINKIEQRAGSKYRWLVRQDNYRYFANIFENVADPYIIFPAYGATPFEALTKAASLWRAKTTS
jgi:hypothetical protein